MIWVVVQSVAGICSILIMLGFTGMLLAGFIGFAKEMFK